MDGGASRVSVGGVGDDTATTTVASGVTLDGLLVEGAAAGDDERATARATLLDLAGGGATGRIPTCSGTSRSCFVRATALLSAALSQA